MNDSSKLNYSSFQMSGDAEALDVSSSSPARTPLRTPMKLPPPQSQANTPMPDSTERLPMRLPAPQTPDRHDEVASSSSASTPPLSNATPLHLPNPEVLLTSTPVPEESVSSTCDVAVCLAGGSGSNSEQPDSNEPQSSEGRLVCVDRYIT